MAFHGVHFEGNSTIPMLVMEFVPVSLKKHIEDNGPLGDIVGDKTTLGDAGRSIMLDVAQGLSYLHGLTPPLIHRDLTSNNVLLTHDLHAKIADFGTSKFLDQQAHQKMTNVPGNQSHMPPEALLVGEQGYLQPTSSAKKLDIFSFGNVLINVLAGEFPVVDIRERNINEVQRRQHLLCKIAESKEKDLIVRCLNKSPDKRPTTDELVEFFKGEAVEEEG